MSSATTPVLADDKKPQDSLSTSLGINMEGETETVRIMAPTNANIALLQPPRTSKSRTRSTSMEYSTASTGGNTDISILRTYDSHYGDDEHDDNDDDGSLVTDVEERNRYTAERLQQSIDFTVVSCALEESTEILHFHTIKAQSQNGGYSGTDSDIEVLMSEEINDTEWSAALENLENNALELKGPRTENNDCSIEAILAASTEAEERMTNSPGRRQESTDRDCSLEEFSRQSSFDGTGLNREQLVNVIREQRVRIRELESTLTRYRDAQSALFEHVDALRMEFATPSSPNVNK